MFRYCGSAVTKITRWNYGKLFTIAVYLTAIIIK